jgi:hypothetical protein
MTDIVKPIKAAMSQRFWQLRSKLQDVEYQRKIGQAKRAVTRAPIDAGVTFPSHVSFDRFIDVEALKALDNITRERLMTRDGDDLFWTGHFTPDTEHERPGGRIVWLTEETVDRDYYNIDQPQYWREGEAAKDFPEVMDFIRTLPFKSTGRILIMYDVNGRAVPPHRDHPKPEVCNHFIWMRMTLNKQLYLMNSATRERQNVEGYSAWFDTVNQYHGVDASEGLSISLRVDGVFTDELQALIPKPEKNAAAAASLWAARGDAQ